MPLVINTNVLSLNVQRLLAGNTAALEKTVEKLASGYRINRAADDAAGLQISETLRAQIRGIGQAINNAQDGVNLLAVAEGTLEVIQENLQRIRELTVQAANDTNDSQARQSITEEIKARLDDIDRIAKASQYNGRDLLNGDVGSLRLQVGPNALQSLDTINIASALGDAKSTSLGITTVDITSNSAARSFLTTMDNALNVVSGQRADIGTFQNRLESAINNLSIAKENFSAAESRIRNVDVASEAANLTRNQILQQAAASVLAQANQAPTIALGLIRG